MTRSKGDHSQYPGALVAPDGEIYFRKADPTASQLAGEPCERRALLEQLDKGSGVTNTLAALAQVQDTPGDRVRRARLLREVLQEIDGGTVGIRGLNQRKARRFLAFLEPEIAWLENVAAKPLRT